MMSAMWMLGATVAPIERREISAVVVPANNVSEAALDRRSRLTPDKWRHKFAFLKELPRNVNGKISRTELRQQLETAE
jgi:acyl-coenzyme A synthetase/AMP-(fatty) acid ligase